MENNKEYLKKYQILFDKIPKIKQKINNSSLSKEQLQSLDNICNFYKFEKNILNKQSLRKKYKDILKNEIPLESLIRKSHILNKNIMQTKDYKNASTIFCYISFNKEIDTTFLINTILQSNKTLCVPFLQNGKMLSIIIEETKYLKKNKFGILEPTKGIPLSKDKIDLTIVPGLVFNPLGYRIGYGGGYYDKFLFDYNGISFSMGLKEFITIDFIPERYDQPVDKIFTV